MQHQRPESLYKVADFDFDLPKELIAQNPPEQRGESRLLVVNRADGSISHRSFGDIAEIIPAGDLLVRNTTRVMRARLLGTRDSGAPAEIFLLRRIGGGSEQANTAKPDEHLATPTVGTGHSSHEVLFEAMVHPGSKLKPGRKVTISDELSVEIVDTTDVGTRIVKLITALPHDEAIAKYGHIPLPPYISRSDSIMDSERYQTVYAATIGSVAAPTAGLHFTDSILNSLVTKGVGVADVVLHVGAGTFKPVDVDDPRSHVMHEERYSISPSEVEKINRAKEEGSAIWAVGTTSVRTLESAAQCITSARTSESAAQFTTPVRTPESAQSSTSSLHGCTGSTDIFIYPPYKFLSVDHLLTNFHLPRSTLLMLVAAFAGYELTMQAYKEAVNNSYRFFSYGDAMLII